MSTIAFLHSSSQMSGVEFSTLYLIRQLDRSRWTPLVVTPDEGDLPDRSRVQGVEVAVVPRPRLFSTSVYIGGRKVPNPLALAADTRALEQGAQQLAGFLRVRRPALLVTKGLLAHFYGGLAAKWAGTPCVWHVQDRVSDSLGPLFAWTMAFGGRVLAREIIVDAESIARQIKPFVPRERVAVIWNGVDTNEFSPVAEGREQVRAEWNVQPEELLIGVVARLTPWKGQHVLIRAFATLARQFPQARVVLVGSTMFDTDEYAHSLHVEVERLGIEDRVIWAGFRSDMPRVLAALDVVAHTSLEKDSTPLAVVSAMAAGKAIVCTRVDGTAELFDEGEDGLLVPPGDPNALSEKMRQLLQSAEWRRQLGQAARAKAERELSVELYARRCESVFERSMQ